MVVSRALRATGCASCRLNLLRSFTAIAGLPPRTQHLRPRFSSPNTTPRIRLSSSTTHHDEPDRGFENTKLIEEDYEEDVDEELANEDGEEEGGSSKLSAVPWYLEVNAPQRAPLPLSERQQIPELPESPPPILEPLLQQISIDLGLDNLTLLDLRKLDPPPALGANLLMLIGTTRSEKHLHVSADRLCRWLRSTYKLRPDADGLLGRNELKLKLKRKSKRAKLMGKTTADNEDDGMRTGWVCVDVGVVDGVEDSTVNVAELEGFVGFGRRTDGVRIVVQMLTEEKREEMDLERLWRGILKRGVPSEVEALGEVVSSESSSASTEQALIGGPLRRLDNGSSTVQTRSFHTSTRYFSEEARAAAPVESGPEISTATIEMPERLSLNDIEQSLAVFIRSGNFQEAMDHLLLHQNDIPELQHEGWRRLMLEQLRMYLETIPTDQALLELGAGSSDQDSTAFLKCFHQTISSSPSISEADTLIWLQCYSRELGHKGYGVSGLIKLFDELQLSLVEISTEAYLRLLLSILRPKMGDKPWAVPSRAKLEGAMKILQAMYDRGHNILTEDVFVTLQEATTPERLDPEPSSIKTSPDGTFDLPSIPMTSIQRRLHVLMVSLDMPTFKPESRLRLLDLYSRNNHWREFWDIWRLTLRQGQPQTAPLYDFMFRRIAETQHQRACVNVLRTWAPDVEREVPPVRLEGPVAQAVKACLLVADPFVERDASDPKSRGEWISIWRKFAPEN